MEILSLPENEPFITGIEESIDICSNQIMKGHSLNITKSAN